METRSFIENRVREETEYISTTNFDTNSIYNCEPEWLDWTGLRRGAVVIFETIEVTLVTEMKPEWRYGFIGQLRERQVSRTEKVMHSKTCKLCSKKGQLYWREMSNEKA